MKEKCSILNIAKYMLIGAAIGTVATMVVTSNCNISNKLKKATECVSENVSSMFKIN
ncbi:MAG: hypothetical protein IJ437_02475 [Clostridia bacterium]|nr:hypothetical protein [Clostridia bacterium]